MTTIRIATPGEAAYNAYTAAMGLDPQASWQAINESTKRAWEASAKAAIEQAAITLSLERHADDMTCTTIGPPDFPPNTANGRKVGVSR